MRPKPKLLSKTKYLSGLQCPKYLWLLFNDPEKVPEPGAATQHLFEQGHELGELAKKLFPDGIDIPTDGFMENLSLTRELMKTRRPLFEPGFLADGIYSRLDILRPSGSEEWDIVEVKGSTKVKPEHISDISFQRVSAQRCGLSIRGCFLSYVNNEYVRHGEIEPDKLLITTDVTAEVEAESIGILDRIETMFGVIRSAECPDVSPGNRCKEPYPCPVTGCWESLPDHHIFELYRGGKKCSELYDQGILTVKDIPSTFKLSEPQRIQKECTISGRCHVGREGIEGFLGRLNYPLYYLDFETISPVIPLYEGTRPYQRIPFQFSLHVVEQEGAEPQHHSFLADGSGDPRREFLRELQRTLGDSGSVVAYNQSFEKGVLQELAEAFPGCGGWVSGVCGRLVDLYEPFRSFAYYHPVQSGSTSIKDVLPAVTGKSYKGMAIAKGDDASLAFFQLVSNSLCPADERQLRADLEEYCGLDTQAMVWIVESLRRL